MNSYGSAGGVLEEKTKKSKVRGGESPKGTLNACCLKLDNYRRLKPKHKAIEHTLCWEVKTL